MRVAARGTFSWAGVGQPSVRNLLKSTQELTSSAGESNNIDENSGDIRCICLPVDPEVIMVPSSRFVAVKVGNTVVPATDDPVLGDHDTRDGAEEDGVGREVRGEAVRVLQEVPRAHGQPNDSSDVASTANVLCSNYLSDGIPG
jgi:hypothetical protein